MSNVIGYDGLGTNTGSDDPRSFGTKNSIYLYTGVTGDTIQKFFWHGAADFFLTTITMALYDISGGNPNNRVSEIVSMNPEGGARIWYSAPLATPFSLVNGTVYTVCFGAASTFYNTKFLIVANSTSISLSTTLDTPWVHNNNTSRVYSMYAPVTHASTRKAGIIGDGFRTPID